MVDLCLRVAGGTSLFEVVRAQLLLHFTAFAGRNGSWTLLGAVEWALFAFRRAWKSVG